MMKKRLLRLLVILIVALGFSALLAAGQIALLDRGMKQSKPAETAPQGLAGVALGGPFTLTDHTGRTVDQTILEGRYNLIYFGFTFCPAICPTELQKIRRVLDHLGTRGDTIQPVFITVDPERDTVAVMKNYVTMFHPRLIGLTGTPDAVAEALKHWRVYARKVDDSTLSEYTVDHSSYIYWVAPNGSVLGMFGMDQTVEDIIAAIERDLPKQP